MLWTSTTQLRNLERQCFPHRAHGLRLANMTDEDTVQEAQAAQKWLFGILEYHNRVMMPQQDLGTFTLAVGKQMRGQQQNWTEKERLYMALTDHELPSPKDRLQAAFMIVLHLNLAKNLSDISSIAKTHSERLQRRAEIESKFLHTLEKISERVESILIDQFACAIPLSHTAGPGNGTGAIDGDSGYCPICQNSYSAFSEFSIDELVADYPVRIKYCGHIVGKACLEQWLMTPKIDEAKYPYRTCPLCRVQVEGVKYPSVPRGLTNHVNKDRRSLEVCRELVYGFGLDPEECLLAIVACMSEEIACTELLHEIERRGGNKAHEHALKKKLEDLRMEKWAWGFRGNGVWDVLRREWMTSGVVHRV